MMVEYRYANEWDAQVITAMWKKMLDESPINGRWANPEECLKMLRALIMGMRINGKGWYCIIAEDEGKPVGFISGRLINDAYGCSLLTGTGDYVYVEKTYRKQNIGYKLIDMLYRVTKNAGAKVFEFYTAYDPRLARRYAKVLGFTPSEMLFRKVEA